MRPELRSGLIRRFETPGPPRTPGSGFQKADPNSSRLRRGVLTSWRFPPLQPGTNFGPVALDALSRPNMNEPETRRTDWDPGSALVVRRGGPAGRASRPLPRA